MSTYLRKSYRENTRKILFIIYIPSIMVNYYMLATCMFVKYKSFKAFVCK